MDIQTNTKLIARAGPYSNLLGLNHTTTNNIFQPEIANTKVFDDLLLPVDSLKDLYRTPGALVVQKQRERKNKVIAS